MVHLTITDEQYANLLRLSYLGNQVANGGRPESERIAEFDDIEQQLFALAKVAGYAKYADFDRATSRFTAAGPLEGEVDDLLMEYDDAIFWEELARRFALRDLESQMGQVGIEALPDSEFLRAEEPLFEKYWQEFREHGIERLAFLKH